MRGGVARSAPTFISFVDVRKVFSNRDRGEFEAVGPLSLDVREGEFLSMVGPSGCGKTTLLKITAGLERSFSGEVKIDNEVVSGPRSDVSMIFQNYTSSLFPWLTARRNVAIGLESLRLGEQDLTVRVDKALESVGLLQSGARYPRELSGGMQQRVAVARALAPRPRLLLMDEPYGAVDSIARARLEDELLRLWTDSVPALTVLLVTHDPDEAIYLSDRVLVLTGPPARVVEEVQVRLPRPRNQLLTRSSAEFHNCRGRILAKLGSPE